MREQLSFSIPQDCSGMSIKEYARRKLGLSARVLTEQKKEVNGILRNDLPARSVDILEYGDVLTFFLPAEQGAYPAKPLPLAILEETADYLVVNKPWGMPAHPSPGHDCDSLMNAAAYHTLQTDECCRLRPLFRLDKDTSGVVILAKHKFAALAALSCKTYLAVCEGKLSGKGTIDEPICLEPGSKIRRRVGNGSRSVTHWQVLGGTDSHTLVKVFPETGRTHQIRVHFSFLGYPLAGDDLYGGGRDNIERQALHCCAVHLDSPLLSLQRTFFAPCPVDIETAFPWVPALLK